MKAVQMVAWQREPVLRLRNYLSDSGAWNKAHEEELLRQCNDQVQAAAQAYLDTPAPAPDQMFDHLYATLPAAYAAQRVAVHASSQEVRDKIDKEFSLSGRPEIS